MPRGFFFLFALLISGAHAADDAARREVLAAEKARTRAMLAGDRAALGSITSDDYTHVDSNGRARDKARFLELLARADRRFETIGVDESTVRIYGDTAVVTGRYHNAVRTPDGVQPTKHARFTRVYVRQGGAWRNVAHQATEISQAER
jgi:ketosteroid isomerase-like protein